MTETLLDPAACLAALESQMAGFEAVARTADPSLPVAVSSRWGLSGLISHLGRVHLWAADTLASGKRGSSFPGPAEGVDPPSWYRECADHLLAVLAAADPADPCWNFSVVPRVKAFWFRRQLHETTIHRFDAETAAGRLMVIDAVLAADGVDEVLRTMLPVGHRWDGKPLPDLPGPIQVRAVDLDWRWTIEPSGGPSPAVTFGAEATAPVATIEAPAEALYPWFWQRTPVGSVHIGGDRALVEALIKAQITP